MIGCPRRAAGMPAALVSFAIFAVPMAGLWLEAKEDETSSSQQPVKPAVNKPLRSAAYQWLDIALEATAREHERHSPRPTVGSRMLAMIVTAMYDGWSAYDAKAIG